MHIVLQSGSNAILKRMNRKYTRQIFLNTIGQLKNADPDFTFTTDIIVGFPGETEEDFQETMQMIGEVQFAKVHMFPFSPRNRTQAASYPNQVPQEVIQRRKQELLRYAEKKAFELRERYVGREMSVLVEAHGEGHTTHFLPVKIEAPSLQPHDLVSIRLIQNTPEHLIGIIA